MTSQKSNKFFIVMIILAVAIGLAVYIVKSAPKPKKGKPEDIIRLVETQPLLKENIAPQWHAGGEVIAKQKTSLMPQVAGRILWVNPEAKPGALLSQGTVLARIDNTDFELALAQRKAEVAQAEAQLLTEQGQSEIAKQEFEMAQGQMPEQTLSAKDRALVLREPQIKSAQAALKSAQAKLQQAQLDLKRTEIRMPYDGAILHRNVSVGSQVNSASMAFEVADTSEFWLEVKVARQFSDFLASDKPARVRSSSWPVNIYRDASIISRFADVSSFDRQSRVLLSISQPLLMDSAPAVLLGDYLDVTLTGQVPDQQYVIATSLLSDNEEVWVVNNHTLQKRTLSVVYKGREKTWVKSGFEAGDTLLTSNIRSVTPGTKVRVKDSSATQLEVQP